MNQNTSATDFPNIEKSKFREKVIASGVGALATSFIVTPFDVVKTRLQAQGKAFTSQKCFLYYNGLWDHVCFCNEHLKISIQKNYEICPWLKSAHHFTGTADAFAKIVKYEGITSLWSGLSPTLIMAIPATVLYFTLYDQWREYICHSLNMSHPPMWVPCITGTIARILTVIAVSPMELIRTKMQSDNIKYQDLYKAIRTVIKQRGFVSLWHGCGPTILRDVPFSVIYWTIYESAKKYNTPEPSILYTFLFGAGGGMVAAVVTYPLDVVKTYRQVELGEIDILQNKRTRTKHILMDLYRKQGLKFLYRGIVPRLIKIVPSCAIMISSYEYGKSYFLKKQKYAYSE